MRYRDAAIWIYDMPPATRWTRRLMVLVGLLAVLAVVGLIAFIRIGMVVQLR